MRNERSVPRALRAAALAVLAIMLFSFAAEAADLYRVEGIPVDQVAQSAVLAREQAIDAGKRQGLVTLMQRLTAPNSAKRLPSVEGINIERYVESFDIGQEKLSDTRYVATLNVTYAPERVRDLLAGSGLPFITAPVPVLILPVWRTAGGADLWGEDNPWRDAWSRVPTPTLTADFRQPLGDLSDLTDMPMDKIQGGDEDGFPTVAERYGVRAIEIVSAELVPGADGPGRVIVEVRHPKSAQDVVIREEIVGEAGQTQDQLLDAATARLVPLLEADAKQEALRPPDTEALEIEVPLVDLRSWVQITQMLSRVPAVQAINVQRFGRKAAIITLAHTGKFEDLEPALDRAGLTLTPREDGTWLLQAAGAPAG
ncbi:MAG: DUF2066 domain-containing protein [Geminicoccaceae bacterium]